MNPLLFVDVDGVLNVPRNMADCTLNIGGVPCHLPEDTAARLRSLLGWYEPVWATAWFKHANALLPHLGIYNVRWPVLKWDDYKLPAIREYAAGRPWAWIDDDVWWELDQLDQPELQSHEYPLNIEWGLTQPDVDALILWRRQLLAAA